MTTYLPVVAVRVAPAGPVNESPQAGRGRAGQLRREPSLAPAQDDAGLRLPATPRQL